MKKMLIPDLSILGSRLIPQSKQFSFLFVRLSKHCTPAKGFNNLRTDYSEESALWMGGLTALGGLGVFLTSLLDSAFIPLPTGPDLLLMSLAHRTHALAPLYVMAAVSGSTIGSLVLYWIARTGGEVALRRFGAERRERVRRAIDCYGIRAMITASLLPPPFPFKLFVLSAGAFRMEPWRFILSLVIGRGLRFGLEGLAAVYYGEAAASFLKKHYLIIGLSLAAALIITFMANRLIRRRSAQ